MTALHRDLGRKWTQTPELFRFQQAWNVVGDVGPAARNRANHAISFKILIGARNGIRIDSEFRCQFANGWQEVFPLERSRCNRVLQLRLDLKVERNSGGRANV